MFSITKCLCLQVVRTDFSSEEKVQQEEVQNKLGIGVILDIFF